MKKILVIALAALCIIFAVSCDADSILKTAKGLQSMSDINLANASVKEDSLNFVKDGVITDLVADAEDNIYYTGDKYDKDYMSALAVVINDIDQKGQDAKLREALSKELGDNSLYSPGSAVKSLSTLVEDILELDSSTMVSELNSLLTEFGISASIGSTADASISKIQKIANAILPAAVAFDAVNERLLTSEQFTAADYLTYHMLTSIMENAVEFINSGDTSIANLLDSEQADNILACIGAVSVINDIDFDLPSIVSGLR